MSDSVTAPVVALIHWAFPPVVGGVESHLWDYSRELVADKRRVVVFSGTPEQDVEAPPGVVVVHHRLLSLDTYRQAGAEEFADAHCDELTRFLLMKFHEYEVEIAHAHNVHHFSAVPARALVDVRRRMRSAGRPLRLAHTYHSVWYTDADVELASVCAEFDDHYAVSSFLGEMCRKFLGVEAKTTYLGVDHKKFSPDREGFVRPAPRADGRSLILLPARLIPDKGAEVAVRALAGLRDLDVVLQLTTAPTALDFHGERRGYRRRLRWLIVRNRLTGRVKFVTTAAKEMPALYDRADVVVAPSVYLEPLGLVPLEAMAAGRPVVVADSGGLPETVGRAAEPDEESGALPGPCLVPANNPRALADALRILLTDDALAGECGAAGRKRVATRFRSEDYTANMLANYTTGLAETRRRTGAEPADPGQVFARMFEGLPQPAPDPRQEPGWSGRRPLVGSPGLLGLLLLVFALVFTPLSALAVPVVVCAVVAFTVYGGTSLVRANRRTGGGSPALSPPGPVPEAEPLPEGLPSGVTAV